jgi:hypothetical protein
MTDLTPEDEALIARARDGLTPGPDEHARIKRRVLVQIAAGTVAATAALSTSAEAAVATGAGVFSAFAKILAAGVLGAAVVGVGVVGISGRSKLAAPASSMHEAPTRVPAALSTTVEAPAAVPIETEPVPTTSSAPQSDTPPVVPEHRRASPAAPPPPSRRDPVAVPTAAASAPAPLQISAEGPSTLVAEAALLSRSDAALRAGNAARALELVDEHATSYPRGVLIEEREAERVVVLCALGRVDDARATASAFLRDHPRSTQASRVRASCDAP